MARVLPLVRRTVFRAILAALAWGAMAQPVAAQTATTATLGRLSGANRMQILVAGARKEGSLTLYTSASIDDMTPLIAAFQKAYGVKVNVWRGASVDILQRTVTEARGQRYAVDVIESPGSELEAIDRENLLQEIDLPVFHDLMPQATAPHRAWVATRLIVFTAAYNTNLLSPAQLPKRYEDLVDPKWKGKLGIEATDANWFMTLVETIGEEKGLKLFREIVATNGLSVRNGHSLLANLVASGEVPLALNAYRHFVIPAKRAGAPIGEWYLAPILAVPSGGAVAARAPHPYAAILFLDFLLSDGQKILAAHDAVPTNLKYQRLPAGFKLNFLDVGRYVDEGAKWQKLYKEIVTRGK